MSTATSLTIEVTATIKARQSVDLVVLFQNLPEQGRARYRDLDIADLGFDEEWERPLAFLWPEEDDVVPLQMIAGAQTSVRGDIDNADVRLAKRGETGLYGAEARWTEGDFETLSAQVPWLRHFHHRLANPPSQHELDRLPGPDDVPLF